MITALDANVLVALWDENHALNAIAVKSLQTAALRGRLVISAPVYVEIRAVPIRDERWIDDFLAQASIDVDWAMTEQIWREAARASNEYSRRRGSNAHGKVQHPRRIAADFLIGAHAWVNGLNLLTMDRRTFQTAFPGLNLISL